MIRLTHQAWRKTEEGFTLIEVLVSMTVTSIFIGLIMFFMISYWRYGYLLEADLDTFITRLNAGDVLRESFSSSSGLVIQNGIPDVNRHNPDPLDGTGQYWLPIHAIPSNTPVGTSGTTAPLVYYKRPSQNLSGAIIMNGAQPFEDEFIIYLNGTTKQLLHRSLANPSATGNRLKTSCPAAIATSVCPADKIIASDLASVDMRYFSRTGNPVDYTSVYDPDIGQYIGPDYPVVDVIEFKLNITKKPIFQKTNATTNSTIVRIALRNT